jgi:nitrate reductase delta subunit
VEVTEVVALGFRYPTPTAAVELDAAVRGVLRGSVERHMRRFVEAVSVLSLGEWEELHTFTLDLSPLFVPYVGHVVWGENYRRGEFMAALNRDMADLGVDVMGELPDHIDPVLRYLAATAAPLEDLVEVLPAAVATMAETLERAAADNPYRHLLAAVVDVVADLRPLTIGVNR